MNNEVQNVIKTALINKIKAHATEHNYSQRSLSHIFEMHQARVSNLLAEKRYMFTIDELVHCIDALGLKVQLEVTPK